MDNIETNSILITVVIVASAINIVMFAVNLILTINLSHTTKRESEEIKHEISRLSVWERCE